MAKTEVISMHIMVHKRFMRKCHTCFGHGARVYKLLIKKPPGIMSTGSASIMCEQSRRKAPKGLGERREEGGEKYQAAKLKKRKVIEEGDEHRVRR